MAEVSQVLQTPSFSRAVKKLKANQKVDLDLDEAVRALMADPLLGDVKKGDLAYLRVYKFRMARQLTLLGYHHDEGTLILELMALGSHENFYRDVKRST